ncbi:MAG TPA: hypothetical protein VGD06_07140 [Acidobacteriota bacterium]
MNKACSYGEEQLASLLYEDGDEVEMAELRAHLAGCVACRAELEDLTSTRDLLSAWPNAVNVPRMVYVNERSGFLARARRWADEIGGPGLRAVLQPIMAAAAMLVVLVAAAAMLDLRVASDGSLQIGLGGGPPAAERIADAAGGAASDTAGGATSDTATSTTSDTAGGPASDTAGGATSDTATGATSDAAGGPAGGAAGATAAGISKEEFEEGLTEAVAHMEELFRSRSDEERRLLLAAIDERMQEQGLAMSEELRGAVGAAFADIQQQQESDLGLVFSAIDELGVITGSELQRMNNILASLMQRGPDFEEE